MARIAPLDPADAQGTAKEVLDRLGAGAPNMAKTMARSSVLAGWKAFGDALAKGSIRKANSERISLAVSEANACSYCLSAHHQIARNVAKLSEEEIDRARRFDSEDPKAAAILAFAQAVLEHRGKVSDEHLAAARAAGLTDAELEETVGHVALTVLTNYFNNAFQTENEFELVLPRGQATAAA